MNRKVYGILFTPLSFHRFLSYIQFFFFIDSHDRFLLFFGDPTFFPSPRFLISPSSLIEGIIFHGALSTPAFITDRALFTVEFLLVSSLSRDHSRPSLNSICPGELSPGSLICRFHPFSYRFPSMSLARFQY